jgi:hypothetical protein
LGCTLTHPYCHSILFFLGAFMYTCFFSSSLATRFLVGTVLVAIGVLVALCIQTGWTNGPNSPQARSPLRENLRESDRVTPTLRTAHDVESQGRNASTDTLSRCSYLTGNDEGGKRRRTWPLTVFFRPTNKQ